MTKIILVSLISLLCKLVSADNVPVLIWGSNVQYQPASAMKFYDENDFIDVIVSIITSDTVTLVISEDELSTEVLSQCKAENGSTCFQGIQQTKDKLYLPNVEDPVRIMEDIAEMNKIEIELLRNGSLSKSLNDPLQSYIFIDFERDISDETQSTKLTRHDQLIMKLYNELLSKNQPLLVIFTGKRSKYDPCDVLDRKNISGIFWKADQFLLFYTDFHLVDDFRNESMIFDEVEVKDLGTTVNGTRINITMTVTESEDYFTIVIIGKNGNWWVNETTWNHEELFLSRQISAAHNFSFHCTPSTKLFNVNRTVVINWKDIQLQPNFNSTKGKPLKRFGAAWDCVYFFSPGIMCGLFVVFLLLFILFVGISCIMDINTYDRFDNPRSKVTFNEIE